MNFKGEMKKDLLIGVIVFALFLALLFLTKAGFQMNFIAYICLFLIAAQGWNLLGGYIGEISFGHAVFFGLGAYTVGLPIGYGLNIPLPILVVLGGVVGSLFAYIIAYPLLRIKGFPFLIGTFGLGIVFEKVFVSTPALFATKGIFIPPVNKYLLYATIGLITIAIIILTKWLIDRDLGLRFKAVRDTDIAAQMVGINIFKTKRLALVIGAFYVGIAGSLFALYSSFVHPLTSFNTSTSLAILLGPYIGGVGTILGPVFGGILVIVTQELSRIYITVSGGHHLVLGLMLAIVMLSAREGLYPTIVKKIKEGKYKKRQLNENIDKNEKVEEDLNKA